MEPRDKPFLVIIDDEPAILSTLTRVLNASFEVLSTTDAEQVLEWVKKRDVHVVLSDQRMPGITGVELLKKVSRLSPSTMRVLLTGYADMAAVIDSINESEIFRYISKPWTNQDLENTLLEASEISMGLFDERGDLNKKLEVVRHKELILYWQNYSVDLNQACLLDTLEGITRSRFRIDKSVNSTDVIEHLESDDYTVLVVSLSQTDDTETYAFLGALRSNYPLLMIIAIAPDADLHQAVTLINHCQVYRYHSQPVKPAVLRLSLLSAVDYRRKLEVSTVLQSRHQVDEIKLEGEKPSWYTRLRRSILPWGAVRRRRA